MNQFNWEAYIKQTERLYASVVYSYGFDRETAEDVVYGAYLDILERKYEPTVALGRTIVKNMCLNMMRNKNRRPRIYNERTLPFQSWDDDEEVLLEEIAVQDTPLVSPQDFDEVLTVMERDIHQEDYMLIMLKGLGYDEEYLKNKFHLSKYQMYQRIRTIRNYLNYKFPSLFDQL